MALPQEIELWHVIPLIRKLLVKDLKKRGLKQKEIASLLGITEPAVSQYIQEKRAKECDLIIPDDVKQSIHEAAGRIIANRQAGDVDDRLVIREINNLSTLFKEKKLICKIHMQKDDSFKECNVCYEQVTD
ncbi:TPA: hypothetical protein HA265_02800 [Candidatus Woesearchaeota archaeon]|nr:hypothetical protein [Candidatus Woesearchaeota archaeon]